MKLMKNDLQLFKNRLQTDWLPAFCADTKRQFYTSEFKDQSIKITEFDAGNFMRAIDSGVVCNSGGGRYR